MRSGAGQPAVAAGARNNVGPVSSGSRLSAPAHAPTASAALLLSAALPPRAMIADTSAGTAMAASSTRHILIVDDDGDLLEVLKFVLEDEGYHVSTAEGGAKALSAASSQEFSLVLLDVSMPDMSGIDVAKRLRADPRTASVRLALHTGRSVAEVREQFTDYDAFIGKTENAVDLVTAIEAAIEQPATTPSRVDETSETAAV